MTQLRPTLLELALPLGAERCVDGHTCSLVNVGHSGPISFAVLRIDALLFTATRVRDSARVDLAMLEGEQWEAVSGRAAALRLTVSPKGELSISSPGHQLRSSTGEWATPPSP